MSERVALETLNALEERLRRLELLLRGDDSLDIASPQNHDGQNKPARIRVQKLEQRLSDLCTHSKNVDNVLKLQSQVTHLTSDSPATTADDPLSTKDKQSIVLASADLISATASRLNLLDAANMPDNAPLADLVAILPQLQHARRVHDLQALEIEQLRKRTMLVLGKWYDDSVVRQGEQWCEWEQRLSKIEQHVRRREHHRTQEAASA